MRTQQRSSEASPSRTIGEGWGWFITSTLSQAYLVFMASLLLISLLPLIFGWQSFMVRSGSMEPQISAGDVVLASAYDQDSPAPMGGVVVFRMGGDASAVTLHRIVDANDDGTFVTAGDANVEFDASPLERADIIGVGRVLVPFIGLPALWLSTGQALPFAVWAALTAFAVFAVVLVRMPRKDDSPEDEDGDDAEDELDAETQPTRASTSTLTRRSLLAVAITVAAGGMGVVPRGQASAAFTGVTANLRNSWSVAALPQLTLGRMTSYALFAGTSVTNAAFLGIGTSVSGSVGTSPGNQINDFWPWDISGSIDRNNTVARNARTDAQALITAIVARRTTRTLAPTLTGTVAPGVYASSTGAFTVNGTLILDAKGDSSAVFIFRGRTLRAAANSRVQLVNGASADRVFWRAESTVTLDQASTSQGTFLANGAATMARDSRLVGRLISMDAGITVTRATVSLP
jgi:signal peptidase I